MTRTILILGAIAMASAGVAQQPWEVAEQLDLVPTPQQISLDGGEVALAGCTIIAGDSPTMTAAAGEINDRVTTLGGEALLVADAPGETGGAIVVGVPGDLHVAKVGQALGVTVTAEDPGPQGYVIAFGEQGGRPLILCAGSDELGALYACVTLRQMIVARQAGVVALSGSVRDWPDFRWRCNGRADLITIARRYNAKNPASLVQPVAELKHAIDGYLRMKVNHLHGRMDALAADATLRAAQEDVIDYAAARGIHLHDVSGTVLNDYLTDEQKEQALQPRKGRFYMWSALDTHRQRARDLAEAFAETKTAISAIHPVDGGAYLDPETWSKRRPADSERYGDDRAAASIEQFGIYFDTFREIVPDMLREAVVYPYHFQFALPDFPERYQQMNVQPYANWWRGIASEAQAREVQAKLIDYHRKLAEALDDDIIITFREAGPDVFRACAELYPGHPIDIWIYAETYEGWQGTFFPQARFAKTFVRDGYDDYYFAAGSTANSRDDEACRMAQAEYIWNADAPDASAEFTVESRLHAVGGEVTNYQRESLIPRIARRLYGGAADVLGEVMAANVSYNYVGTPGVVMARGGENDGDVYAQMAAQAAAMDALFPELEALMDRVEAGEIAGPSGGDIREDSAFGKVLFYYKYTGLGAVKARLEAEAARARGLLAGGDKQQAIEVAQTALGTIDEMAGRIAAINQRVEAAGVPVEGTGSGCKALDAFAPAEFAATLTAIVQEAAAEAGAEG